MIKRAYELALRDGFSPKDARAFLMASLPFLSDRTFRQALPEEAKEMTMKREPNLRHGLPQFPEPKQDNVVNITTKAELIEANSDPETDKDDHSVYGEDEQQSQLTEEKEFEEWEKDPEINRPMRATTGGDNYSPEEDPKDTEIAFLKEKVTELEDALKQTKQFVPAGTLSTKDNGMTDEIVFDYLRNRAKETGNILFIDRVGSGALVTALARYKGSFNVGEVFVRVIS